MNARVLRCVGVLFVASVFFQSGLLAQETEIKRFGAPQTDRQVQTEASRAERAAGRLTLGGRVGESTSEGYLDILQPLFGGQHGLLFLNPKLSGNDDDESEWSIGLGGRVLLPKPELILGANVFYDERETRHNNTFDQIGAGVEMLSKWVDVRGNYYWPDDKHEVIDSDSRTSVEQSTSRPWWGDIYARRYQLKQNRYTRVSTRTTTRYFNRFEAAMEGYDLEVGLRLPFLPEWLETRVFGGYYSFESDFSGDIDGYKGRLEIRALPALVLDGEIYENKDLTGSDYFLGLRVDLPFDLWNLARGRNPFEGIGESLRPTRREMRDRLSDMVMRDPHVRMTESGWIEDVGRMTASSSSRTFSKSYVVLDDVNFVNNANVSGIEDGSAEHPWHLVQEGVDAVFGLRNVYVFQGIAPYDEHVMVGTPGVKLRGEGTAIPGFGGKVFGGNKYPVMSGVQGGVNGPAMRIEADDVFVTGFNFARPAGGVNPGATDPLGFGLLVDEVGILALNANGLLVENNKFSGQYLGVGILGRNHGSVSATVRDNEIVSGPLALAGIAGVYEYVDRVRLNIENNSIRGGEKGIGIEAFHSGDVQLRIMNNTVRDTIDEGIYIASAWIADRLTLALAGNSVRNATDDGVYIDVHNVTGDVNLYAERNSLEDNDFHGLHANIEDVAGNINVRLANNVFDRNLSGGALLNVYDATGGVVTVSLLGNRAVGNDDDGLYVDFEDIYSDINLAVSGNVVNNNADDGIQSWMENVYGKIDAEFRGNVVEGNGDDGFDVEFRDTYGVMNLAMADNTARHNDDDGMLIRALDVYGDFTASLERNNASENGDEGIAMRVAGTASNIFITVFTNRTDLNGWDGTAIEAESTADGGHVVVAVDHLESSGNDFRGLWIDARGGDNSMVAGYVQNAQLNGNVDNGLDVYLSGGSSVNLSAGEIEANSNGGHGVVTALSSTGTVIGMFGYITASDNDGSGLSVEVLHAPQGIIAVSEVTADRNNSNGIEIDNRAGLMAGVDLNGIVANENANDGLRVTIPNVTNIASLRLQNAELVGNGDDGMNLRAIGAADIMVGVSNVTANQNAGFGGIMFLQSTAGGASVEVEKSSFSENTGYGLEIQVPVNDDIYLHLSDVAASANGALGLNVSLQAPGGAVNAEIETVTFNDNGDEGAHIVINALNDASAMIEDVIANGNGVAGLVLGIASAGGVAEVGLQSAEFEDNQGRGASIDVAAMSNAFINVEDVGVVRSAAGDGLHLYSHTLAGNAVISIVDVVADDNAGVGVDATARVESSGTGDAEVAATGLFNASGNSTGAVLVALNEGTGDSRVQVVAGAGSQVNDNTGHGVIVAAQGVSSTVSAFFGAGEASDNGRYGLVAVPVGTSSTSATVNNSNGTGNGDGNSFINSANSGTWQALLP